MKYSLSVCKFSLSAVVFFPLFFRVFGIEQNIYIPIITVMIVLANLVFSRLHVAHETALKLLFLVITSVFLGFLSQRSIPFFSLCLFIVSIFISIQFFRALSSLDETGRKLFTVFFTRVCFVVLVFGIYQFFANGFDLPFSSSDFDLRGRGQGFSKQVTSFFEEPAFYGLFLLLMLMSIKVLHLSTWSRFFFFLLILVNVVLSKSIISFGGLFVFFVVVFLRFFKGILKHSASFFDFTIFVISFFSVPLIFIFLESLFSVPWFTQIWRRLDYEFVQQLVDFANLDRSSIDGSGALRTLGEFFDFIYIYRNYSLTGLGFFYGDILPHRISALNAYVEFFVRFGVFGFLILWLILREIPFKITITSFLVLNFYFFADGAVSKFSFWVILALCLFFGSVNPRGRVANG